MGPGVSPAFSNRYGTLIMKTRLLPLSIGGGILNMRTNCMFRNNSPQQLEIEDESHSPWQTNLHHSYQARNVYHPRWLSENSNPPPYREVVGGLIVSYTNLGPFQLHQMLRNSSLRKSTLRDCNTPAPRARSVTFT